MHGGRRRPQLMDLFLALRPGGRTDRNRTDANGETSGSHSGSPSFLLARMVASIV
jgi:hypothetical protein